MLDLLTIGEAFDDFIFYGLPRLPRPGEELRTPRFARALGGGAITTAIVARRLGISCAVASGMSEEVAGHVRAQGVRAINVRRAHEPTAVTVALSTRADRAFVTYPGLTDRFSRRLLERAPRVRARHVHFALGPASCGPWRRLIAHIRRRGATTSWDFGWNPRLLRDPAFDDLTRAVDVLFVNRAEAIAYARRKTLGGAVGAFATRATATVVKLGARGARLVGGGLDLLAPAHRIRALDPTGAGDAFNAGFLAALLRGRPYAACLRAGNSAGRRAVRSAGGSAA